MGILSPICSTGFTGAGASAFLTGAKNESGLSLNSSSVSLIISVTVLSDLTIFRNNCSSILLSGFPDLSAFLNNCSSRAFTFFSGLTACLNNLSSKARCATLPLLTNSPCFEIASMMLSMFLGVISSVSVFSLLNVVVNPPTTSKPAVLAFSTALSVFLADSTNNSLAVCFKSLRYRFNNSLFLLPAIISSNRVSEITACAKVPSPKLR